MCLTGGSDASEVLKILFSHSVAVLVRLITNNKQTAEVK